MLWSPKKRTIMSVQIFLNLHLSFQRSRIIIISFARLNYISFLLLFNSQIQVASQKKVTKNISYHSLIVTSAIPSPMSDNLNGRISPFIPYKTNKQTDYQYITITLIQINKSFTLWLEWLRKKLMVVLVTSKTR